MSDFRKTRMSARRHRATFNSHDGSVDAHGNPTLSVPGDWTEAVAAWPVEMIAVTGGEVLRGRTVSANTTHVLFGDYQHAKTIAPEMQCVINSQTYEVVSVLDAEGNSRELRVEIKREL